MTPQQVEGASVDSVRRSDRLRAAWSERRTALDRFRASRWGRVLTGGAAIGVVAGSAWYLVPHVLQGLRGLTWQSVRVGWAWLGAAIALITGSIFLGAPVLRSALNTLGRPLPRARSQVIQTTSNLAGYLPGFGWRYLGKAYLLARDGVPARDIALAMSIEFVSIITTALLVIAVVLPGQIEYPIIGLVTPGARAAIIGLLLVLLTLGPVLASRAIRRREGADKGAHPKVLWLTAILSLLAWGTFGLGFACLVRMLGPLPQGGWQISMASLAASFVVSLLAVFVPGGLGVRESIMTAMLSVAIPSGTAAVAAVFSRVVMLFCELLAFVVVRAWVYARSRCARPGDGRHARWP